MTKTILFKDIDKKASLTNKIIIITKQISSPQDEADAIESLYGARSDAATWTTAIKYGSTNPQDK